MPNTTRSYWHFGIRTTIKPRLKIRFYHVIIVIFFYVSIFFIIFSFFIFFSFFYYLLIFLLFSHFLLYSHFLYFHVFIFLCFHVYFIFSFIVYYIFWNLKIVKNEFTYTRELFLTLGGVFFKIQIFDIFCNFFQKKTKIY